MRGAEGRRNPRADAAAARDELADRLPHPAALDRILSARVCVSFDERIAQEARHLVARQRSRRLVGRERKGHEVEHRVLVRVAVERPGERAGAGETAAEGGHDHRVIAVGRRLFVIHEVLLRGLVVRETAGDVV